MSEHENIPDQQPSIGGEQQFLPTSSAEQKLNNFENQSQAQEPFWSHQQSQQQQDYQSQNQLFYQNSQQNVNQENIVYGRYFITKPGALFQQKKLIMNVLWSGMSLQPVPSNSSHLEVIKYKDIMNIISSQNKDNEFVLVYTNRRANSIKQPQVTCTFKSEDRQGLLSDLYKGIDKYGEFINTKQLAGIQLNFESIFASFILDKSTKSHFDCKLTCYNSHLQVEYISESQINKLNADKFTKINHHMMHQFHHKYKDHQNHHHHHSSSSSNSNQKNNNLILSNEAFSSTKDPLLKKSGNREGNQEKGKFSASQREQHANTLQNNLPILISQLQDGSNLFHNDCASLQNSHFQQQQLLKSEYQSQQEQIKYQSTTQSYDALQNKSFNQILNVRYKDIIRISKKQNGFQINLLRPSLCLSFHNNDINILNQFIIKVQKNAIFSIKQDIVVTSTLIEQIHNYSKLDDQQFDVDFAIQAKRVIQSKTHKRACIITVGKSGIAEIDQIDKEIYESYDLRHLKDVVREEYAGSVRNSIKLVFFNGIEVEYVFKPFQRDVFLVELLTNINMYYDTQAPCRRCLDIIHSRSPNYYLEIRGWKIENGLSERDHEVDQELMKNIAIARGDEKFFSALREFNVNCHLKNTIDADVSIYRQLVLTLGKYLQVFDDPELLIFIKHIKIMKDIPHASSNHIISGQYQSKMSPNQISTNNERESGINTNSELNNSRINEKFKGSIQLHSNLSNSNTNYNNLLISLQRDANSRLIDEDFAQLQSKKKPKSQEEKQKQSISKKSDLVNKQQIKKKEINTNDQELEQDNKKNLSDDKQSDNDSKEYYDGFSESSEEQFRDIFADDEEAEYQTTKQLLEQQQSNTNDKLNLMKSEDNLEKEVMEQVNIKKFFSITEMNEDPLNQKTPSNNDQSKIYRSQQKFNHSTSIYAPKDQQQTEMIVSTSLPLQIIQQLQYQEQQYKQSKQQEQYQSVVMQRISKLCAQQSYKEEEEELIKDMREKSISMLKKTKKKYIKGYLGDETLKLDLEIVENYLVKIEEMLKCLIIFQNCKRYFEDKLVKSERFKEFRRILQLLSCPDALTVYLTSQLFKKIGLYYNNTMQKAETENKNFLLDNRFNILDRVFYQISNCTLIKRALTHSTYMIRIYSCLSIINTLFQSRIESTHASHRQSIINHLQSPVFFAVANRLLRYNSFSLLVNTINLLNALYYYSSDNKQFINMLLLNSTILIYLIHLIVQQLYSSKQLKEISFNLLYSLIYNRSQPCYVLMNIFPKSLFKLQKTESLYVDQWNKQEWHNFFFREIQTDIRTPHYFWLKSNLKQLDDILIQEDKQFLQQQISILFKRISHAKDLQQFFPKVFLSEQQLQQYHYIQSVQQQQLQHQQQSLEQEKDECNHYKLKPKQNTDQNLTQVDNSSKRVSQFGNTFTKNRKHTRFTLDFYLQLDEKQQMANAREIFASLYWNIDDFKVEYNNLEEQQLCGRYYLKQLLSENKRLMFEFVDAKGQIMEKEVKELWESLILSLMSEQQVNKQQLVLKMMCCLLREYSKVVKFTNVLQYLIRCLNLREFTQLQYNIMQLILVAVNCDDSQSKQYHCKLISESSNGIEEIVYAILSRINIVSDNSRVQFGEDATGNKLQTVVIKQEENIAVIFTGIKIIKAVINNHSHILKKRQIFPLTKSQQILFQLKIFQPLLSILLASADDISTSNMMQHPQSLVRNEFLLLVYNYLLSVELLNVPSFCEILLYQINNQTSKVTFTIIKALFYLLPDPQGIVDEIIEGQGLQYKHLNIFPFFKYLPLQFMLILLNPEQHDKNININNGQSNTHNNNQSTSITNLPYDSNVEATCNNFKSDKIDRYDLIWSQEMRILLKEKLHNYLTPLKQKIESFYTENFRVGTCNWKNNFRGMCDQLLEQFPVDTTERQLNNNLIMYPKLKNELVVCQLYLRPWSKCIDIEHESLPFSFSRKVIQKISQYSSQPDMFKVINNNTSSAAKNLLILLKSQTKIYRHNIFIDITYPYNHLLIILMICFQTLQQHISNPSELTDIDQDELDNISASQSHSPLLSQIKRNSSIRKQSAHDLNNNSTINTSIQQQQQQQRGQKNLNDSHLMNLSQNSLELSFSQTLVDTLESTLNNFIKKIFKLILLSIEQQPENLEEFCKQQSNIECLLQVLNNVVLQISLKNISKQDIREYFEDVSVSYSEIKILTYGFKILYSINQEQNFSLSKLSQQQRNDMCLLLQRAQKITVIYFRTFVEKYNSSLSSWTTREKYGNNLQVPGRSTRPSTNSNISFSSKKQSPEVNHQLIRSPAMADLQGPLVLSQAMALSAASHPRYDQLLDRLFNVDPETLTGENDIVVDKYFESCRALNNQMIKFILSLSHSSYFLESLVRGGCVWRSIEIILAKGKAFNSLHNSQKQKNVSHMDEIAEISAKTMSLIILHCNLISQNLPKFNANNKTEISSPPSPLASSSQKINEQKNEISTFTIGKQDLSKYDKVENSKLKTIYLEGEIIEEEQSRNSLEEQEDKKIEKNDGNLTQSPEKDDGQKIEDQIINEGREDVEDEFEKSEKQKLKSKLSEEDKKEILFINMQYLKEIGAIGRDKLQFFVNQFMVALSRNVDSHLLKYLREDKYEQFCRKINSNIELPDFIWNQLSRDNLDTNLKLQIINVNQSLGKTYLDKLLEHQGIIQIGVSLNNNDDHYKDINSNNIIKSSEQYQRDQQQKEEVQISGVFLHTFNESDNFELTNPQTFQQEVFNQLKKNILKINQIIHQANMPPTYDSLSMNQHFESQARAVKECIKATLSLLTRYSVSYIVLNPDNICIIFNLLQMELEKKMNLSAFKLQIAKVLNEISGQEQGCNLLIQSQVFIQFIITNLLNWNSISTAIIQQFLSSIQKIGRIFSNQEKIVKCRIVSVLILNSLKKEYFKQALRVQIVEVLNEMSANLTFLEYFKTIFPIRIFQKLYASNNFIPKPSIEVIEILDNVVFSSDMLWTNQMRLELIMVLEQELNTFLQDSNFDRPWILPQYPEMLNETVSCQVFLRIFNMTPASIKLSDLNNIAELFQKQQIITDFAKTDKQNEEVQSLAIFSEIILQNLIELTENYQRQFISLQNLNLEKRKDYIMKPSESALIISSQSQLYHPLSEIAYQYEQFQEEQNLNSSNILSREDEQLQQFDRVSIQYITCLTSLMLCIEHIIIQEKRNISEHQIVGICKQLSILSENRSHSHIKSTVIQIAYLLKDQLNIQQLFINCNFYVHISNVLNYSVHKITNNNNQDQDNITSIEQLIIINLLIKLIRDKSLAVHTDREKLIYQNKQYIVPIVCKLLESITEDNSYIKSYLIGYCAEVLKSGYYQEEICNLIDETTFSSKQLIASKNTYCEWINLWRQCIINYSECIHLQDLQFKSNHDILYDTFFNLPIQSEFSVESLPFPPKSKSKQFWGSFPSSHEDKIFILFDIFQNIQLDQKRSKNFRLVMKRKSKSRRVDKAVFYQIQLYEHFQKKLILIININHAMWLTSCIESHLNIFDFIFEFFVTWKENKLQICSQRRRKFKKKQSMQIIAKFK